jgi:hypothetical protein
LVTRLVGVKITELTVEGARTVLTLQYLLVHKSFAGFETRAKWLKSISTVAGSLNGTTAIYELGLNENGIGFTRYSPLRLLMTFVYLWEWIDIRFLKNRIIDFNLDHWQLSWRKTGLRGLWNALKAQNDFTVGSK